MKSNEPNKKKTKKKPEKKTDVNVKSKHRKIYELSFIAVRTRGE